MQQEKATACEGREREGNGIAQVMDYSRAYTLKKALPSEVARRVLNPSPAFSLFFLLADFIIADGIYKRRGRAGETAEIRSQHE